MFFLKNKVALITGAATGIGAGIAVAFARQGADVAISDKPGENLNDTREKAQVFGNQVFCFDMDVRNMEQIGRGVEKVMEKFGKIDILVNNAGINKPFYGLEISEEIWMTTTIQM